ncbi:MAG: hypothetical protein RL205_1743 [Actinomycetota bacterium]
MAILNRLAEERTDLTEADIDRLHLIVSEWSLLADLAGSDLVLWLPTWNEGGLLAVAQVRATTAPTNMPDDVVGSFVAKGRSPHLDQAAAFGRVAENAYPVNFQGRVIGIVERHSSPTRRVAGRLEEIYLQTADDLFAMLVAGTFPSTEIVTGATGTPRVGDGLIRLDDAGLVEFASPNAVSAMRRLGLATELIGADLCALLIKLSHKHGPVDEALSQVASGQVAGSADVDNGTATVLVRGIPILDREIRRGAIVLLQDATEIRRRERALMSKDATIREIHHRVKNNLQTVAALLRLQGRRAQSEETREALAEAQLRVASIAVVHESLSKAGSEDVPFEEVVDRVISLVRDLAPAYAVAGVSPVIEREGECSAIPEELVTPLAMAVSELLQNAVEHAKAARIRVVISEGAGAIGIDVIDDGAGLPDGFTMESAGLGLQIVESLVQNEARGTFRLLPSEGHGTAARIEVRAGK